MNCYNNNNDNNEEEGGKIWFKASSRVYTFYWHCQEFHSLTAPTKRNLKLLIFGISEQWRKMTEQSSIFEKDRKLGILLF